MNRNWLNDLLGLPPLREGDVATVSGRELVVTRGILRDSALVETKQAQTRDAFAFKWAKTETYSSPEVEAATIEWERNRFGNLSDPAFWKPYGEMPLVLDAGCGAGLTARLLIGEGLHCVRYIGADISTAVDVAAEAFHQRGLPGYFIQADLLNLPFAENSFDYILSEGVLHHTPSTRAAIHALARLLKTGGVLAFYVYKRKSPVREFTDDFIREQLQSMSPEEAWSALMPLTKLGIALGKLDVVVDVPEDVQLLGIPKGPINLQRLIYWHVCKMYYRPEYSLDEMNHVNFDWFTPAYSHRQSPEEVRKWCEEAGLDVRSMKVEEAGITTEAVRTA